MLMPTVVAVALGVAPVTQDPQPVNGDYSGRIGNYSQSIDRQGTTHVRGHDPQGRAYELTVDRNGNVEASIGERVVNFRVIEG